jgi:hypothetical protein
MALVAPPPGKHSAILVAEGGVEGMSGERLAGQPENSGTLVQTQKENS